VRPASPSEVEMATKIRSDDFENLLHCLMKTYLKFRFQRGLESDYEERAGLFPSRLPAPKSPRGM
jgi:hypothetical protein